MESDGRLTVVEAWIQGIIVRVSADDEVVMLLQRWFDQVRPALETEFCRVRTVRQSHCDKP